MQGRQIRMCTPVCNKHLHLCCGHGYSASQGQALPGSWQRVLPCGSTTMSCSLSFVRRAVPTGLNAATLIGDYVTVEPYCTLRSCRIEPKVLIGARSVVCEGAIVETESILAPGSVVPPARRIPSGELWGGSPARFIRKLTGNEVRALHLPLEHLRSSFHTAPPFASPWLLIAAQPLQQQQ